jgi:hypothetical protein
LANTDEEKDSSFLFPYKLGYERECIIKMEEELRYLIDTIMTDKHSASWLANASALGPDGYYKLVNRQQDDIKKFPNNPVKATNLIQYCYIHELKEIIDKNWVSAFSGIFPSKDRTLQMLSSYKWQSNAGRGQPQTDALSY